MNEKLNEKESEEIYRLIIGNAFHNVTDGKVCPVCKKEFTDINTVIIGFDNEPVHKECWHIWLKQIWDEKKSLEDDVKRLTDMYNSLTIDEQTSIRWWKELFDSYRELKVKYDIAKAEIKRINDSCDLCIQNNKDEHNTLVKVQEELRLLKSYRDEPDELEVESKK